MMENNKNHYLINKMRIKKRIKKKLLKLLSKKNLKEDLLLFQWIIYALFWRMRLGIRNIDV